MHSGLSVDAEFGKAVARLRTQRAMSQRDLAEALTARGMRVDASAISRIENGSRSVRLAEALTIAGALNEELSALVGGALTPEQEFIYVRRRAQDSARELRSVLQPFMMLHLWAASLIRDNPELLRSGSQDYFEFEAHRVRESFAMMFGHNEPDEVLGEYVQIHSADDREGLLSLVRAYAESMLHEQAEKGE